MKHKRLSKKQTITFIIIFIVIVAVVLLLSTNRPIKYKLLDNPFTGLPDDRTHVLIFAIKEYIEPFENTKNSMYEIYENNNCTVTIDLFSDNPYVFELNNETYEKIELTSTEISQIEAIKEACYDLDIYLIYLTEDRFVIKFDGNNYALVYSMNGKKPSKRVLSSNEELVDLMKLGHGWYLLRT